MQRDIFISYSRKDLNLVKQIKEEIDKAIGTECWMDLNGIESGSPQFTKDIVDGINNCKIFLFMLSEQSQESEFALRELNYAYQKKKTHGKRVVIINISNCKLTDEFEFMYGLTDTILWTNSPQHDKLISDLRNWVGAEGANAIKATLEKHLQWSLDSEYFVICNSTPDIIKATTLKQCIENRGFHVWTSYDCIPNGINYSIADETALKYASHIVLILTPYSARSRWVWNELDTAIRNGTTKKVKVVLGDNFTIDDARPELRTLLDKIHTKYNFVDITTSTEQFNEFLNNRNL